MDLEKGGRGAIERMVEAYGFSTRQALCDQLGVSKGTLANRYMRDSFPADWVIQCVLETGVSLKWLTTGNGPIYNDAKNDVIAVQRKNLVDGFLLDSNYLMFDKALHPSILNKTFLVNDDKFLYVIEYEFDDIVDGKWLVKIEGKYSIKDITRIPISKVIVGKGEESFQCKLEDISFAGKIALTISSDK
ncbi:UNVERIFIED_ORG: hypothetical protein M2402_002558 [Rahnella aquatilis]